MTLDHAPDVISTREYMQGPDAPDKKGQVLLGLGPETRAIVDRAIEDLRKNGPQSPWALLMRCGAKKTQYGNLMHSITYIAPIWEDDGKIGLL